MLKTYYRTQIGSTKSAIKFESYREDNKFRHGVVHDHEDAYEILDIKRGGKDGVNILPDSKGVLALIESTNATEDQKMSGKERLNWLKDRLPKSSCFTMIELHDKQYFQSPYAIGFSLFTDDKAVYWENWDDLIIKLQKGVLRLSEEGMRTRKLKRVIEIGSDLVKRLQQTFSSDRLNDMPLNIKENGFYQSLGMYSEELYEFFENPEDIREFDEGQVENLRGLIYKIYQTAENLVSDMEYVRDNGSWKSLCVRSAIQLALNSNDVKSALHRVAVLSTGTPYEKRIKYAIQLDEGSATAVAKKSLDMMFV